MTIGTKLFTLLKGELVGTDMFGNRYFREKKPRKGARERRWVMYKGIVEPSKVPAEWHGWLHYTAANPPEGKVTRHVWEKPHQPNLTGTQGAYLPPGHLEKGARRSPTTADYQAWKP